MSNVVYEQIMYNEEIKNEFLSTYPATTAQNYRRIFLHSRAMEEKLGKDVYLFSANELDQLIAAHKAPTIISVRMIVSVLNSYIVWAMTKKLTRVNHFDFLSTQKEWPHCHVAAREWLLEETIDQITDFCENAQDGILFRLIFEGVSGRALQEVINLKIDDVDFENKILTLRQEIGTRTINVSDKLLKLISEAYAEHYYQLRNGTAKGDTAMINLIPSKHVVKNCRIGMAEAPYVSKQSIWKRIKDICEMFGLEGVTIKSLVLSGELHMANMLYTRDGELGRKQYQEIADQYGHNFWWVIKNNITMDALKEVYGLGGE